MRGNRRLFQYQPAGLSSAFCHPLAALVCFLRDSHWSHLHHSHQTKEVKSCKTTQLIITTPATILPKVMLKMLETRFTPNFNWFIIMCAILNGNCQGANPQFLSTNSLTNRLETD
jgi:hypothetical protein